MSKLAKHGFKLIIKIRQALAIMLCLYLPSLGLAQEQPRYQFAFNIEGEAGPNVIQDSDGFLWFTSMFSGLVRFDGTNVKRIYASEQSITNDFVTQVFQDSRGYIWVGSNYGLTRYDKTTNEFRQYFADPKVPSASLASNIFNFGANTIVEDKLGYLWFGTGAGLSRYDHKTDSFISFYHQSQVDSLADNEVWALFIDRDGLLWVGSQNKGVTTVDVDTLTFKRIRHDPNDPRSLPGNDIHAISQGRNGAMWFGTKTNGLIKYEPKTQVSKQFIEGTDIVDLQVTRDNKLVVISVGTVSGLLMLDLDTEVFTAEKADKNNPFSISSDSVRSVFEDRFGIRWVVHSNGKVDKYDPHALKFNLYLHSDSDPHSIASNVPIPIYEDKSQRIWIGMFGDGLERFDRETGQFFHHTSVKGDEKTIPNGYPAGFLEDREGNFYVSTFTGLVRFDPERSEVIEKYSSETSFYTLIQDEKNPDIIWANGWEMHFNQFNLKTKARKIYLNDPNDPDSFSAPTSIRFVQDAQQPDYFWIATWGGGLERFDRRTEKFKHHQHDPLDNRSIGSNTVYDVYQDKTLRIWVATDRGLSWLEPSSGVFTHFNSKNGFPATRVFNILEDKHGKFWLGTNVGLVHFDPQSGEVLRVYTKEDGLHSHDFFPTARGQTQDGQLWFGGFNGLNSFYPDQLPLNTTPPKVFLTALQRDGKTIDTPVALEHLQELALDWRNNDFDFEYVALNFTNASKNRYQYMLEGYDDTWYQAGARTYGRYTNLPGGEYRLKIKGSNNDGFWSVPSDEVNLRIFVTAPPWRTLPAYLAYLATLIGLVYGYIKYRERSVKQEKMQLEQLINDRTQALVEKTQQAEQANEAKSRFLANMSHELRTPLNAVLGFSEILHGREVDPQKLKYLDSINSAGNTLLGLINEVLDLAKIESGKMRLELGPMSLVSVADHIQALFSQQAAVKDLLFKVECASNLPTTVLMDSFRLNQVLMNLCGNAIKFTEQGEVSLSIKATLSPGCQSKVDIAIEVVDTGKGIPSDQLRVIFNAFEQVRNQKTSEYGGTGLGLAITKQLVKLMGGELTAFSAGEGQGATFSVLFSGVEVCQLAPLNLGHIGVIEKETIQFQPARILVVDDIEYNRELMLSYLEGWPFEIKQAENGEAALKLFSTFNPDIVFTDLKMPVMDGKALCQHIRREDPHAKVKLVMVTASIVDRDEQEISQCCDEILFKPIAQASVINVLKQFIVFQAVDLGEGDHEPLKVSISAHQTSAEFTRLPVAQVECLIGLIESGSVNEAEKVCLDLLDDYAGEAKWLLNALHAFEFERILAKLRDLNEGV